MYQTCRGFQPSPKGDINEIYIRASHLVLIAGTGTLFDLKVAPVLALALPAAYSRRAGPPSVLITKAKLSYAIGADKKEKTGSHQ
jgi:hypothetical protein